MAIKFLNTVAVDTSVLYVNAANNRVGINTVSPDNTLSVGDGTVDESLAVYHSDGTFTRINGYGLYMSRSASYIRPTSGNSQTLYIGNVTKPWSGTVYNANTHYFRSGANENMRITSSGKVGIGTTSPNVPLEINGANTTSGQGEGLRVTRPGLNSQYISIDEADGSKHRIRAIGDKPFEIFSNSSSYGINFSTNGTQKMTILTNGNVGIGTTSPGEKLTVAGDIRSTGTIIGQDSSSIQLNLMRGASGTNSNTSIKFTQPLGNGYVGLDSNGAFSYGISANLITSKFKVDRSGNATFAGNVGIGTTSLNEKLSVDTGSNGSAGYISVDSQTLTRLKLGYSFTSSPSAITAAQIYADSSGNLDISSRGNAASAIQLYTSSGTSPSERMRIASDGKVGIGTTSPGAKLTVVDDILLTGSSPSLTLTDATSSFVIKTNTAGEGIMQTSGTSKPIRFFRNNGSNESMRIDGAGNVGIGTTSPDNKLHVDGNGNSVYAIFSKADTKWMYLHSGSVDPAIGWDSAGDMRFGTSTSNVGGGFSEKMRIDSSGNVGIGTTSPNAKLDIISGTNNGIRISATDTTSNWRDIDIKSYVSQAQANAFPDGSAIYTTNPSGQTETAFSKYGGLVIQGRDDGNSSFAIRLGNGSGYATRMFMGETGATVFSNQVTATNFITSSDERLKENIKEAFGDKVEVNWKTFELKTDKGHKRYGVIAQDLEKNHPEFVKTDNEGMKSVAYTDLLIAKIAELENRIQTLENK